MNQKLNSLISRLPSDSLTVIRGNDLVLRNGDVHYPFRQDSDFLYLTGLSVPGLVVTIFLTPDPSPKIERNSGNSPSLKEKGLGDEVVILWREPIGEKDIIW